MQIQNLRTEEDPILVFFRENLSPRSARELRDAAVGGDRTVIWSLWRRRMAQRAELIGASVWRKRLRWGLSPDQPLDAKTESILELYDATLEMVGAFGSVPAESWIEHFCDLRLMVDSLPTFLRLEENPLAHQLALGEFYLLLGTLYPELGGFERLTNIGRRNLIDGLRYAVDALGFPTSESLGLFRPLLACWTRAAGLAERVGGRLFSGSVQRRYEWATLAFLRFSRSDGRVLFDRLESPSSACTRGFLDMAREAFRLNFDTADRAAASAALRPLLKRHRLLTKNASEGVISAGEGGAAVFDVRPPEEITRDDVPAPWCFSENSRRAVLRGEWSLDAPSVSAAVIGPAPSDSDDPFAESDERFMIEGACGKQTIFSGPWEAQIRVGGETLEPVGGWTSVCEEADGERLYWELAREYDRKYRIERQILLIPSHQILLLADAVIRSPNTGGDEAIDYRASLPLGDLFAAPNSDEQAREITLSDSKSGRPRVRILPITLTEWKTLGEGEFSLVGDRLELRQRSAGGALYAAALFDLDVRRMKRKYTWRLLTVGRNMKQVPDSEAVGVRVQLDERQFLFYKNLAEPVCRSVLGAHFDQDFICAEFLSDGHLSDILQIEPEETF